MMDMVHRRTFILFIPCVQALFDLCEALISGDALFLQDGGLHYHLEVAFLVVEKEGGGKRIGEGKEGEGREGSRDSARWGKESERERETCGKKWKWRGEYGREREEREGEGK